MKVNPQSIKPAVRGKSYFFSWQLYRWARQKPELCSVFAGTWNSFNGIDRDNPTLYIGLMDEDGWFHGKPLRGLCSHGANLQSWAFGPAHDTGNWNDVTEEFWADYLKRGVCAIHGDLAHEWEYTVDGKARSCLWCNKQERQKTIYRPVKVWETEAKAA